SPRRTSRLHCARRGEIQRRRSDTPQRQASNTSFSLTRSSPGIGPIGSGVGPPSLISVVRSRKNHSYVVSLRTSISRCLPFRSQDRNSPPAFDGLASGKV